MAHGCNPYVLRSSFNSSWSQENLTTVHVPRSTGEDPEILYVQMRCPKVILQQPPPCSILVAKGRSKKHKPKIQSFNYDITGWDIFMLRSEVLRLYRQMLRLTYKVANVDQRKHLQKWIRGDFENNRYHTEEEVIRMMISKGKLSLHELEQTIMMVQ